MNVLDVVNVSYSYPNTDRSILQNVTLTVKTGQTICIQGSNGSGKSTLAKICAGLITPSTGKILVNGKSINSRQWNGIALLLQNADEQLITSSVEREIAWGLENLGLSENDISDRVEVELTRFGIKHLRFHSPLSLSDGEKQLIALASLIAMKPMFLILDEITAYLSPLSEDIIRKIVKDLTVDMGIVWITARGDQNFLDPIFLDNGRNHIA